MSLVLLRASGAGKRQVNASERADAASCQGFGGSRECRNSGLPSGATVLRVFAASSALHRYPTHACLAPLLPSHKSQGKFDDRLPRQIQVRRVRVLSRCNGFSALARRRGRANDRRRFYDRLAKNHARPRRRAFPPKPPPCLRPRRCRYTELRNPDTQQFSSARTRPLNKRACKTQLRRASARFGEGRPHVRPTRSQIARTIFHAAPKLADSRMLVAIDDENACVGASPSSEVIIKGDRFRQKDTTCRPTRHSRA